MAKKSKKIEKETRRLIEGITDLVKKKGNKYKFKTKNKKQIKRVKRTCPHWNIRKGKEIPTVVRDKDRPDHWRCIICGATWPVSPGKAEDYDRRVAKMLEHVNQIQFWAVKLGGDAEDTKMFLKLKELLPRFAKVSKQVVKQVNKKNLWETNRQNTDILSQFDAYASFNYRQ